MLDDCVTSSIKPSAALMDSVRAGRVWIGGCDMVERVVGRGWDGKNWSGLWTLDGVPFLKS